MMPRKLFILFFFLFSHILFADPLIPIKLRCENIQNPLGIDVSTPRLSWQYSASANDEAQIAYEIIVHDNLREIKKEKANMWASGKITSSNSIHIEYKGKPLESFTRYYWRVKVYNKGGETFWSDAAWFETAMLKPEDWTGVWIDDGKPQPQQDIDHYKEEGMPLFRKDFTAKKAVSSARLYISGLGYYEASLNGKPIGDRVLDPGWTAYGKQVLYSVYDVSSRVQKGDNVIGVMLGNGWWNPLPIPLFGRWDLRKYQQTGRPCLRAELHVHYADSTHEVIPSDQSWITTEGPVMVNSVYLGEHYDARREIADWNTTKARNKRSWKASSVAQGPSGKLTASIHPPVVIIEEIKPERITNPGPDTFIIDMGVNFAGVARIKVKGPAGRTIRLRYGEDIFENGRLNYNTSVMTQIRKGGISGGPGAPPTAWQEDVYILKGDGVEEWEPRFTFHSFRYVEVTGWPGKPSLHDFEGVRQSAALEEDGEFACSNEMFNKLQTVIHRTFRSNVFSVQSDCPAREKLGYGADIVVTANAFIYNYDMSNFYSKAVQDFANDQQEDGAITETAPFVGIADRGYGGNSGPLGWQLGFPFVLQQLYQFYGDKRIIETNYDRVVKQMDFLQSKAVEGLFHWDIGDHEALDPRAEAFSAATFYYHHALLAKEFASLLDKKEDSVRFSKLSDNIKRLIVRKYLVPKTGRFDNGTQAAQIFALWYGLSPEPENTVDALLKEFERHDWHVSSGIFGVKMMFDVLREMDRNDIAYRVANQKDFPGWGHMLESEATTLWETWEYPKIFPSQNHPMFGSISEWFYRSLLGINPGEAGFERIVIKPQPAGNLTWAKGHYNSVRGKIESDWRIDGETFRLTVSIPANTTAEVWIPTKDGAKISQKGKEADSIRYEGNWGIVTVGSGKTSFESKFTAK